METESLNLKIDISDTAAEITENNGYFTILNILDKTGLRAFDLFRLFNSKRDIILFWYAALPVKYDSMINEIEDFDSYTLSEKISNFTYTIFDMLDDFPVFVNTTHKTGLSGSLNSSGFFNASKSIFRHFIENDNRISAGSRLLLNNVLYDVITRHFFWLLRYHLEKDSPDHARSVALTDKAAGLLEEIFYSPIPDKGFDLFKYMINPGGVADGIPFIGNRITEFFSEKEPADE